MSMEPLRQELTENSYTRETELTFAECDRDRNARPAALLSLVATVPAFDYDARGLPYAYLHSLHQVFLLSRASIKIHTRPQSGDVLAVTTWEDGTHGAHMRRVYQMADREGNVLVSAKSEWILVDPESRKILRPGGFTAKPITVCPRDIDCPECKKLLLPKAGTEDLGVRTVRWTDLDGNGHMYSGKYGDVIWDALPQDLQSAPLHGFSINYSREARLGETLSLRGFREPGAYSMEGLVDGVLCFVCKCEFK